MIHQTSFPSFTVIIITGGSHQGGMCAASLRPLLLLLVLGGRVCLGGRPLLVFLIDGFRFDYMDELNGLPGFRELVETGVKVDYVTPEFPSLSYPNYYSLMTGKKLSVCLSTLLHETHDHFTTDVKFESNQTLSVPQPCWSRKFVWSVLGKKREIIYYYILYIIEFIYVIIYEKNRVQSKMQCHLPGWGKQSGTSRESKCRQ